MWRLTFITWANATCVTWVVVFCRGDEEGAGKVSFRLGVSLVEMCFLLLVPQAVVIENVINSSLPAIDNYFVNITAHKNLLNYLNVTL